MREDRYSELFPDSKPSVARHSRWLTGSKRSAAGSMHAQLRCHGRGSPRVLDPRKPALATNTRLCHSHEQASKQWMEGKTLKGLDASPARNRASTSPQQRLTGLTGRTRSTSKQVGNSLESERGPPEPGRGTWNLDFSTPSPPGTFCRSDVLSDKIRYLGTEHSHRNSNRQLPAVIRHAGPEMPFQLHQNNCSMQLWPWHKMDLGGNIDKLLPFYVLQIRKHRAVALHYCSIALLKKKAVSGSDNGHGGHGDFDDRSFRGSENRNRPISFLVAYLSQVPAGPVQREIPVNTD
ncbi:hypothetical protein BDP67DRAFT_493411 [Colletotrichum lupini]|nr:hypothetical protein BDP67DRAFT_493411 [Colletotrichum lupini]